MSSCRTAPTSTTASSASSPSRTREPRPHPAPVVIACGALGGHLREIIARRGWRVELHCLPALLHNRPSQIITDAERIARRALARGQRVALAYADCGTYGALDGLCARLGLRRLPGLHCYDVLAELGLDRHPQLWPDYFGHYRRVVWLAQHPDPALTAEAERVAAMFGLPLTIMETGTARLERELARLVGPAAAGEAVAGEGGAG